MPAGSPDAQRVRGRAIPLAQGATVLRRAAWFAAIAMGLLAGACAHAPPEQRAREEAMWEAARRCQSQFTTIASVDGIDADGRLRYTCLLTCPDRPAFEACYTEHLTRTYKSGAVTFSGHLATESFNSRIGVKTVVVSYRGTAPALTDVIGGQTTLMVAPLGSACTATRGWRASSARPTWSRTRS